MKKLLFVVAAFAMMFAVNAQIKTPYPSPNAKLEQMVGLADVTIEYSRPAMRERTIFGGLVPYGKVWRTGANERTKITFSADVSVGGNVLKTGTYGLFTIPQEKQWEVIFYTDHGGFGTPAELEESKVAARIKVDVKEFPMTTQSFTMSIDDIKSNSAVIGMYWENTYVGVPFELETDKAVMASIDKVMNGPNSRQYFVAASYYYREGKDIKKAKEWIDKAIALQEKPRFWELRQQSLIYAKAGDKKGAVKIAKKSLKASEEAGNDDFVKRNKESIEEWSK